MARNKPDKVEDSSFEAVHYRKPGSSFEAVHYKKSDRVEGNFFKAEYYRESNEQYPLNLREELSRPISKERYLEAVRTLITDYFPGNQLNTSGNDVTFYLIGSGVVKHAPRFENGGPKITLIHESKKGLEELASTLNLPNPSKAKKNKVELTQ